MKNAQLYRMMLQTALDNQVKGSLPQFGDGGNEYGPGGPTELGMPYNKGAGAMYGDKKAYGMDLLNLAVSKGQNPLDIRFGDGTNRNAYYQQLVSALGEDEARTAFTAATQFAQTSGIELLSPNQRLDKFYNSISNNQKVAGLKDAFKNYAGTNSFNSFAHDSPLKDLQDTLVSKAEGGFSNEDPTPKLLTKQDRANAKKRFLDFSNKMLNNAPGEDSKYVPSFSVYDADKGRQVSNTDGQNCINGVCAIYENIGIPYSQRYTGNQTYFDAVNAKKEDVYRTTSPQVMDHIQFMSMGKPSETTGKSYYKPTHSGAIYSVKDGVVEVINNGGQQDFYISSYSLDDIKARIQRGEAVVNRIGAKLDEPERKAERLAAMDPKVLKGIEKKNLEAKKNKVKYDTYASLLSDNPGLVTEQIDNFNDWSLNEKVVKRGKSLLGNDTMNIPGIMQDIDPKFLDDGIGKYLLSYMNDESKVMDLAKKYNISPFEATKVLKQAVGVAYTESRFGKPTGIASLPEYWMEENMPDKLAARKSIGPYQIRYNSLSPERRGQLKSPKALYYEGDATEAVIETLINNHKYLSNRLKQKRTSDIPGLTEENIWDYAPLLMNQLEDGRVKDASMALNTRAGQIKYIADNLFVNKGSIKPRKLEKKADGGPAGGDPKKKGGKNYLPSLDAIPISDGTYARPTILQQKASTNKIKSKAQLKAEEQLELQQRAARSQGALKGLSKDEYNDGKSPSVYSVARSPMTAASKLIKGQQITKNFDKERNVLDNAVDVINPVNYIQTAVDLKEGLSEGDYLKAGLSAAEYLPLGKIANSLGVDKLLAKAGSSSLIDDLGNKYLPNAHILNPNRFKTKPNAYYRTLGEEGYGDAKSTGRLRAREGGDGSDMSRPSDAPYFSKGKIGNYPGNNIVAETLKPLYKRGDINPVTRQKIKGSHWGYRNIDEGGSATDLPVEDVKFFKKDWLKRYKEIPKPQQSFKSEIDWAKWNKEIPENKALMQEYDTIEKQTKTNGTWMKNADGSAFQGTPEQFIQQKSENFKKAFPEYYGEKLNHNSPNKFDIISNKHFGTTTDKGWYGEGLYTHPEKEYTSTYGNNNYEFYVNSKNKGTINKENYNASKSYQRNYDLELEKLSREKQLKLQEIKNHPKEYTDFEFWNKTINNQYDKKLNNLLKEQQEGIKHNINQYTTLTNPQNGEVVIPFNNVVKSAIGNNGVFDMANPNIYKMLLPGAAIAANNLEKKSGGGPVNPLYLMGFNAIANQVAAIKRDSDESKYDNFQAFDMQQPEEVAYNNAYRYGKFALGGQLLDNILGRSSSLNGMPLESKDPALDMYTKSLLDTYKKIRPDDVIDSGLLKPLSGVDDFNMVDYRNEVSYYLSKLKTNKVDADQIANAASNSYAKYRKVVPAALAVAQMQQEGYLASGNTNKPQRTRNPYNVGNVDSGATKTYNTVDDGIQAYYDLMASSYLNTKSATDLLNKGFTNSKGNRYATDKQYEQKLARLINKLQK
jgi:hypothetical protein